MTKEELQSLFGEKRCKPEPVDPCEDSKHGCCPDNFHSAKGPFYEGIDSYSKVPFNRKNFIKWQQSDINSLRPSTI